MRPNSQGSARGVVTDLETAYERYRSEGTQQKWGWGLAWWLAAELCGRFYSSHGIVPQVIERSGLGYYGIELDVIPCPARLSKAQNGDQKYPRPLGRLTMEGDVENWQKGEPGDHGLPLIESAKRGEPLPSLLEDAVRHLQFPTYPTERHTHCRHKTQGASYVLVFELVALLAIQYENHLAIWNSPFHTDHLGRELDPLYNRPENPGYFSLEAMAGPKVRRILLAGDGRIILPERQVPLWERYMGGETKSSLLGGILKWLGLDRTEPFTKPQ